MQKSETDKRQSQRKNSTTHQTFWVLIVLTVLYLAAFCWVLYSGQPSPPIASPSAEVASPSFWQRIWGVIIDLEANELGDLLAGAFAPIAFIWLAGAVFIQSQELKEQRKEVERSNDAFELQAKEMTATTKFIEAQTSIMISQDEDRKADEARNNVRWLLKMLYPNLRDHYDGSTIYITTSTGDGTAASNHITEFQFDFTAGDPDWHREGRELFAQLIEAISTRQSVVGIELDTMQQATFTNATRVLLVIFDMFEKLPATDQSPELWIADYMARYRRHFENVDDMLKNERIYFVRPAEA